MGLRHFLKEALMDFRLLLPTLFVVISPCLAQNSGPTTINELYKWYKDRGDDLISEIRPKLRAVLTPPEREVESALDYRIIITGNNNAFARRNGETLITSGFLQIIDSVATSLSAAIVFHTNDCFSSYVTYLSDGTRTNTFLVSHHQQPQPVAMAFAFWPMRPRDCAGLSEVAFRSNNKADIVREDLIYSSLIYLIGHELSHHINHDPDFDVVSPAVRSRRAAAGLDVSMQVTPAEQAVKERRADLFAFRKMIQMGYPPLAAMPVLMFFMGIEGFSPEQTPDADHPAAVVRFEDMITFTNDDPEFMKVVKQMHKEEEWDSFVKRFREVIGH